MAYIRSGTVGASKNICDIIDEIPEENLRHDTLVFDYPNRATYVSGGYYVDENKGVWAKITFLSKVTTNDRNSYIFRGMPEPTVNNTVYTKDFFNELEKVGKSNYGTESLIKLTGHYDATTPYYVRSCAMTSGNTYTIYLYYKTT